MAIRDLTDAELDAAIFDEVYGSVGTAEAYTSSLTLVEEAMGGGLGLYSSGAQRYRWHTLQSDGTASVSPAPAGTMVYVEDRIGTTEARRYAEALLEAGRGEE